MCYTWCKISSDCKRDSATQSQTDNLLVQMEPEDVFIMDDPDLQVRT